MVTREEKINLKIKILSWVINKQLRKLWKKVDEIEKVSNVNLTLKYIPKIEASISVIKKNLEQKNFQWVTINMKGLDQAIQEFKNKNPETKFNEKLEDICTEMEIIYSKLVKKVNKLKILASLKK